MVWMKEGKLSGFEEIISSSRTHGLDQLWHGWGLKVVKGWGKLLHPPELMIWINCGLDSCGLDGV